MQQTLTVINLGAIRSNALAIKNRARKSAFYAVVKADAYGHGAVRVSHALQNIADGFCVALMQEGAALRIAGVTKPILVFTPPLDKQDAATAAYYNLTVTVNGKQAASLSKGLSCHIKVNTGMNRYGCSLDGLQGLLDCGLDIRGVYSHLYAPSDSAASARQLELFNMAERLVKSRYPRAVAHIAASGGLLSGGEYLKDAVRCGISLYGYPPQGFVFDGLKTAKRVFARRVQQTQFTGGGIGYARAEKNYGTLAAYRAGYADGFLRTAPFGEGNLCMDAFISQNGGEWIQIFGDAESYAKRCGTISYEVLCSAGARSSVVYVK